MGYQLKVKIYIEKLEKYGIILLYCTQNRPTDYNSWKEVMTWYLFSRLLCICGMFMYASRNIIYFIWVQKMSEEHIEGKRRCWGYEVTVGWRHCIMIIFMNFTLYQTLLGWLNHRYEIHSVCGPHGWYKKCIQNTIHKTCVEESKWGT